jgi:hypothetical protein
MPGPSSSLKQGEGSKYWDLVFYIKEMEKIENLNSVSINKCNCFYIRKYIKIIFLFLKFYF